jgi:DNA adenine methylase
LHGAGARIVTAATAARGRPAASPPVGHGRTVQPFLKWAGGKRQLLPALRRFYPRAFGTYFEPFVGSGAVFFDLVSAGALEGRGAILSDINRDVIGCYQAIRRSVGSVVRALRTLEAGHAQEGTAHYYEVRDRRFNPSRERLTASWEAAPEPLRYPASVAAMLIYLNRTGYNGLFRLNRMGGFNVPAGRYARPRICDDANLRAVSRVLRQPAIHVRVAPFEEVLAAAAPGDFVYFDPPYEPISRTAHFTAYTAGGFGRLDQVRLQQVVVALAEHGSQVLLSNSAAPVVADLYERDPRARAAGLRTWRVPARRAINSAAGRRGPVAELLVTNITAGAPPGSGPGRRRGSWV